MQFKKCEVKYTVFDKNDLPFINLPSICIIGRSNAGKSSFINTILEKKNSIYFFITWKNKKFKLFSNRQSILSSRFPRIWLWSSQ